MVKTLQLSGKKTLLATAKNSTCVAFKPLIIYKQLPMNACGAHTSSCASVSRSALQLNHLKPVQLIPSNQRLVQSSRKFEIRAMLQNTIEHISSDQIGTADLVEDAIAWCSQHGLVYGAGQADLPVALVHAPVALLPVTYPRETFLLAKRAAIAFNTMIDAVSRDGDYLRNVLEPAARHDEFTARLLQVHEATDAARAARKGRDISLAINRSDYMLHSPTSSLLQVELNTIASSFGCLSTLVGRMHYYLMERAGANSSEFENLPPNDALTEIASVLGAAVEAHGATKGVMVMVVQPGERNAFDQQWLQLRLWQLKKVKTLRRTLAEIANRGQLDPATGDLIIDGHVASVVYFRAGYSPDDYYTEKEWQARVLIENSNTAACPSVSLQLAGSKKVQQDIANPGVVERFAASAQDAELMRTFFAGLWGLDNLHDENSAESIASAAAVADAIENPESYVLKPQREGGGNNIYGDALKEKLQAGGELGDLILMQRILPPVNQSIMVRLGKATVADTLSELGIYSTYLRKGDEVLVNREAGHLVRTKAASSDEGGVAAGFAVLDSPYLI
jgi:glutathione synthetase